MTAERDAAAIAAAEAKRAWRNAKRRRNVATWPAGVRRPDAHELAEAQALIQSVGA